MLLRVRIQSGSISSALLPCRSLPLVGLVVVVEERRLARFDGLRFLRVLARLRGRGQGGWALRHHDVRARACRWGLMARDQLDDLLPWRHLAARIIQIGVAGLGLASSLLHRLMTAALGHLVRAKRTSSCEVATTRTIRSSVGGDDSLRVGSTREVIHMGWGVLRSLRRAARHQRFDQVLIAIRVVTTISWHRDSLLILFILQRECQLRHELRLGLALACKLILLRLLHEVNRLVALILRRVLVRLVARCADESLLRTTSDAGAVEDFAGRPLVVSV